MHNRIPRFSSSDLAYASALAPFAAPQSHAQSFGANHAGGAMVLIPGMIQAPWQAQVYRLAYEKALADTAPPKHFTRYFSVWN
jgi:hypothetical protein